jgi:hypothetical protein
MLIFILINFNYPPLFFVVNPQYINETIEKGGQKIITIEINNLGSNLNHLKITPIYYHDNETRIGWLNTSYNFTKLNQNEIGLFQVELDARKISKIGRYQGYISMDADANPNLKWITSSFVNESLTRDIQLNIPVSFDVVPKISL